MGCEGGGDSSARQSSWSLILHPHSSSHSWLVAFLLMLPPYPPFPPSTSHAPALVLHLPCTFPPSTSHAPALVLILPPTFPLSTSHAPALAMHLSLPPSVPPSHSLTTPTIPSPCSCGGVVLTSADGLIVCSNTLDERLRVAHAAKLPAIRAMLFADE
jgi:hypothetical protein